MFLIKLKDFWKLLNFRGNIIIIGIEIIDYFYWGIKVWMF